MTTNADITIYHQVKDEKTRDWKWEPPVQYRVNWHGRQAVSIGDNGLNAADVFTVRIPGNSDVSVSVGDFVIKGLHNDADPVAVARSAAGAFKVTSVTDNRRGSPAVRHWKLEGKRWQRE